MKPFAFFRTALGALLLLVPSLRADDGIEYLGHRWEGQRGSESFLEVHHPIPDYVYTQAVELSSLLEADYSRDRRARRVDHQPPTQVTLSRIDFSRGDQVNPALGPSLVVVFRERQPRDLVKSYRITRQGRLSSQSNVSTNEFRVLRHWDWEPNRRVVPFAEVAITVRGLPDGTITTMQGITNLEGQLNIPIGMLREAARQSNRSEFQLDLHAPSQNKRLSITLPTTIFHHP